MMWVSSGNALDDGGVYAANQSCRWSILGLGTPALLQFDFMDIEPSEDCSLSDYILVTDGTYILTQPQFLCGYVPAPAYVSTTGSFEISFVSDSVTTGGGGRGWFARFSSYGVGQWRPLSAFSTVAKPERAYHAAWAVPQPGGAVATFLSGGFVADFTVRSTDLNVYNLQVSPDTSLHPNPCPSPSHAPVVEAAASLAQSAVGSQPPRP